MAKAFHLTVAKIGENLYDGEALSVTVPGTEGVLTVLATHEPLVSPLIAGTISVERGDGSKETFSLPNNGIIEVSSNQVTIII